MIKFLKVNNIIKYKQMKKLSKLVLREHISQSDLVNKRAQKYILGGYGEDMCTVHCSSGEVVGSPYADCVNLAYSACSSPTSGYYCTGNCS